jgi:tetratricopeptide (TPR) repeat protein
MLYLQGKNLAMFGKKEGFKKEIERFEEAIKLEPNFARAYARMAFAYFAAGINEISSDNAGKVKEIVNKALELDPNLAEAYVSRGFVSGIYDWDYRAAEKDYLHAIELEPSSETAHWLYAMNLSNRGRFDDALTEIDAAMTIDPGATMYKEHRGRILYYARRYDEALTQFQQVIDLDDRPQQPYAGLSRIYEIRGDYDRAYQFFLKREERSPRSDRLEIYRKTFETGGWIGVRRELAETLGVQFFDLARLYALQGKTEAALDALNRSIEKREWFIVTLNVEPAFDNLRADPRFDELLGRAGWK